MTTDLEQAARDEAERRNPLRLPYNAEFERRAQRPDQWEECASWLAEYLLSDENVEKTARVIFEDDHLTQIGWDEVDQQGWLDCARAALSAALGKETP